MDSYIENLLRNDLILKDESKKDKFYYDETNNIRKFILKEVGFNNHITNAYFVLGGLIIKEEQESRIDLLKKQLKLGSEVLEIKFKTLTGKKKDLFSLLNYPKIQILIKWIFDSEICIHFTVLNFLYFSLADIPDSITNDEVSLNSLFTFYRPLKDALYQEVMKDIES